MRPTWIITAFDEFDERPENYSREVLNTLKPLLLEKLGHIIDFEFLIVPTIYSECSKPILQKVKEIENLQGVLALGEGAEIFQFETIARNIQHEPEVGDNSGVVLSNTPINILGPSVIDFNFPIEYFFTTQEIADGIELSDDAGTFVCNRLCYDLAIESQMRSFNFGFIHVPCFDQAEDAGWSKERCAGVIMRGFERMIASQKM